VALLDWSVFDTLEGDTNNVPGFPPAPYHLARILVTPNAQGTATFLAFDTANPGVGSPFPFTFGEVVTGPEIQLNDLGEYEPLGVIMANLMATGGAGPLTWSNLAVDAGSPAMAATLTPEGAFSWDTTGSARGPKGNGVLYSWSANVSDGTGTDMGVAIQVSLIPEPSTVTLVGLAMVGLVGLGFRKRS